MANFEITAQFQQEAALAMHFLEDFLNEKDNLAAPRPVKSLGHPKQLQSENA